MKLENIQNKVKEVLSERRYYHSVCVMERCEELAKYFNVDIDTAKKVGIAHDIAKEMAEEVKLEYIEKNDISVDKIELKNTGLLHAKIGADIAQKQFGFTDEMVRAIQAHTTGKETMSMLAKILYLADATGKDRKNEYVEEVKKLTLEDIDKALLHMFNMTIHENINRNKQIHIDTIKARNKLLEKF